MPNSNLSDTFKFKTSTVDPFQPLTTLQSRKLEKKDCKFQCKIKDKAPSCTTTFRPRKLL